MKIEEAIQMLEDWNEDLAEFEDEKDGIEAHCMAIEALKKQLINTKEEKHAKWIQADTTKCKCMCNNCNVIIFMAQYPKGDKNYCPNCGAKMDKG